MAQTSVRGLLLVAAAAASLQGTLAVPWDGSSHPSHPPVAGEKAGRPPQANNQAKFPIADDIGEVYTSSFTYNEECTGPTMACGPNWNNDPKNGPGTLEPGLDNINVGMAAVNTWLFFNNWNGPNMNLNKGWGGGCGQCWELTPKQEFNYKNMQPAKDLLPVGKPIIVTVTDICTDGGTGDQQPGELNSNFGQEVHFDICKANNEVWKTFFGNGTNGDGKYPGQVLGTAKRIACPSKVPQFGSTCTKEAKIAKPENCPLDGPDAPEPFSGSDSGSGSSPQSAQSSSSPSSSSQAPLSNTQSPSSSSTSKSTSSSSSSTSSTSQITAKPVMQKNFVNLPDSDSGSPASTSSAFFIPDSTIFGAKDNSGSGDDEDECEL